MHFLYLMLFSASSISGFVTDAANGEKLGFANIYFEDLDIGSAANELGYYIIHSVPIGSYRIACSYIGYETKIVPVQVKGNSKLFINFELEPTLMEVEGVSVSAERMRFEKEVEVSVVTFTPREIKAVPSLFESDLIKTLQLMPGVVAMHDLSNKMYVRGGSPDENLVLLDGITVYNPSTHLFGLFSTFNPDAVSDVELHAGGFPAEFGDRLSSTLNITTKEGNSKKYSGAASFGLITSKLLIEGPIPKGSFLLCGRRTYFDALVWGYSLITGDSISLPYYFWDGIAKVNFNPFPNDRFTLTALGGSDVLEFEESFGNRPEEKIKLEWGNRGTSLRWRRVLHPKLYGEFIGAWSNFLTHLWYEDYLDSTNNIHFYEDITDYTIKGDFDYYPNDDHSIAYGLDYKYLQFNYNLDATEMRLIDREENAHLTSAYFQDQWSIYPPILSVQYGIRSIYFNLGKKLCLDPRIGIKARVATNTALNLAWGKYSQFLITLNNQESYFSIFDFWRPVVADNDIPTAYHIIAGVEHWFGEKSRLTIEPYYKKYFNLLIPDQTNMFFSQPVENLQTATGYATGVDFFFRKDFEDLFGWISYSLAFTRREIGQTWYSPRYDRRHNLNIVIGYKIPRFIPVLKHSTLNLRWYFATGLPYAEDLARYRRWYYYPYSEYDEMYWYEWYNIKGPRDGHRLPLNHRLDLHLENNFRIFKLNGSWYIDVINVYDNKNILFYTYEPGEDPPEKKGYTLLPIPVPSFGFEIRF
ncbi:hypothetical protein A2Y85_05980 [candidate division WOR-3 bacterium RBG_13_43_14]|uniref:TonB-dependent receptor plug domain-containing protein n=1 Tax=candidate division WOR-3 bacterium RBG_13_43_14 TaxID=1802590 RepID=A0A1F4U248_UNCW3|nr:MAG: hypothetical protein A2Y85_05980 [candidate division WOR-3 bacterium RBG_13_43_14]